jgi:hypothetical protein
MTDPAAAYNFDEPEGEVQDYSGNGRHFALGANSTRVAGHTGNGLTKNGPGFQVVAQPSWIGTDAWTIMFWQQGLGDSVWWVRLYNNGVDSGSGILNVTGLFRARVRRAGGVTDASITPIADGLAHHYCATYDGVNVRLYVDAVLVATSAVALAPTLSVDRIDVAEHTLANFYMDDLRFFNIAIEQPEIAQLMDTPVSAEPSITTRWRRGDGVDLVPFLLTPSGLVGLE